MLTPNGDFVSYLDVYRSSSMPINSAFYIVLIIVTVATFDRSALFQLSSKLHIRPKPHHINDIGFHSLIERLLFGKYLSGYLPYTFSAV